MRLIRAGAVVSAAAATVSAIPRSRFRARSPAGAGGEGPAAQQRVPRREPHTPHRRRARRMPRSRSPSISRFPDPGRRRRVRHRRLDPRQLAVSPVS